MNKHKTLPLRAAFSLLLLCNVRPALAQSQDADTLFNCSWTSATVYPQTILDQATTAVGSTLYSFGGVSNGVVLVNSYTFDGTTWTPIAPLPAALEYPSAVSDGTNIFIMGGVTTTTPRTTNNMYDPVANTYTARAPFSTGTWNHAAVFLGGKIYKFCGTGPAANSTNATEIYDIATNTWSPGPAYPISTSFVSGWAQAGFIYGAGGITAPGSVVQNKTYRLDPANLGAGWVDAAIADLPATRWGAATAFYSPDVVLAGGYVAGAATANISNTAISYDLPTDSWQAVPNDLGERARFTGAVLGSSFYAIGGRSVASPAFVGTNINQKLLCLNVPTAILSTGGSSIATGGNNGVLNPGNVVTVALGVRNTGGPGVTCTSTDNSAGAGTGNIGTLQATGGVTSPSAPQKYGGSTGVCSGITPAMTTYRYYTFTVDPALPCGSTVTATLQMTDTGNSVTPGTGTLTYTFVTGKLVADYSESFDGVVAPALPAGWTTTFSGLGTAATTSTIFPDTAPNDVFLSEASNVALSEVTSATIAVPAGPASRLTFRNLYNTEAGFDGEVLEISIAGGAFQDILAAGGSFVSGGYNATLATGFLNPLPGRMAWAGLSGGSAAAPAYITSVVDLPAAAAGQNIQLKWRLGSDNSVIPATNPGVRIDTISLNLNPSCSGSAPMLVQGSLESPGTLLASVLTHAAPGGGEFGVPMPAGVKVSGSDGVMPVMPITGGVECRRGTANATNVYNYKLVLPFTNPIAALGTVSVTSRDGGTTAASSIDLVRDPTGRTVVVDLTAVADLPQFPNGIATTGEGQILGVTLIDTSDGVSKGNINVQMGLLIGDSNDTRNVNASDSTQIKSRSGQLANGVNFRSDINPEGIPPGTINAADTQVAKNHSGNLIPGIP